MKECAHDSFPLYKRLIGPLREKARELGYALGVHGSLKRDIDLVAAPWGPDAVDAKMLAVELCKVAEAVCGYAKAFDRENNEWFQDGQPGAKPYGRLCWSFYLQPTVAPESGPYIDLSVMPKGLSKSWYFWHGQKHARGCGVAALAIITNRDYEEVAAYWPGQDLDTQGVYLRGMDDYLVDHGYTIARKLRFLGRFRTADGGQIEREPWPPEPFGEIHLCEVTVSESAPCNHFVVMLKDGSVLDPLDKAPKRLSDYHQVLNVAAVEKRL